MKNKLNSAAFLFPLVLLFSCFITITAAPVPVHVPVTFSEETNDAPAEKNKYALLDNGLAVYIQVRDQMPLVNIVFAIDVGSKNEDDLSSGMVHILEHLILLGETEFHRTDEMNREMRRHGVLFNAHTSHDMMTFELSLPARYWKFGLEMIKEKIFHLKFSQEQLDKEKEIIFAEVAQQNDNPPALGTMLALQHLFPGHPYRRPIPGDPEVIKKAAVDRIQAFYRQYFSPSNCAVAVVGDVNIEEIDKGIRELFGKWQDREKSQSKPAFKTASRLKKNARVKRYLDITRAHLIIGFHAPPSDHEHQLAFNILNEVLGKGINPMLKRALVKRGKPLTYGLSTRYIPLTYGGAFLVHITLEPKNLKQARWELIKFLNNSWSYKYSVDDYPFDQRLDAMDYLETARSSIKFSYQQFQEEGANAALIFARYILYRKNKNRQSEKKQEPYMERLAKITSSDIRNAASRYFSGKKYVMISILPEEKKK